MKTDYIFLSNIIVLFGTIYRVGRLQILLNPGLQHNEVLVQVLGSTKEYHISSPLH